jgi:hypothetical protein
MAIVHIDDAVAATVAALTAEPGVYNIVDDDPLPVAEWLPAKAIPLEDLGSLALKGLSQPVSAFNVPFAVSQPALRVIEGGTPSG